MPPARTGSDAATSVPNATSSSTSVSGSTRRSAVRASSAETRRRSAFNAVWPVQRSVAPRTFAVAARSSGIRASGDVRLPSRPTNSSAVRPSRPTSKLSLGPE